MSLLIMHDISKIYQSGEVQVPALKDINLEIDENLFISFIGPSGSGKTTLLNLIGCLDKPTSGEIIFDGKNVNRLIRKEAAEFRGSNIGFIFQNFNLIPVLTVYENVEYPLIMVKNIPKEERKERILKLLSDVGMIDQKDKFPNQISGGQKQRVSIARALVTNPKLILADEPTANLDHTTANSIIQVMRKMKDEFKTSFIFATHDPKVVDQAEIAHTIEDGRLLVEKI